MKWLLAIPFVIIFTGCSVFQPYKVAPINEEEARSKIISHLAQWEICTARGVVAVYAENYELKSDFLLRKKKEKFRMDAFKTGLLGISPSIKMQVLYTDSLKVFVPEQKTLYTSSSEFVNISPSHISAAPLQYDPQNKKFILFHENIKIHFNQNFDLEQISYNDIKILFTRYKKTLPYQIDVWYNDNLFASLSIDKWEFHDINNKIFSLTIPSEVEIVPISKIEDIKL